MEVDRARSGDADDNRQEKKRKGNTYGMGSGDRECGREL